MKAIDQIAADLINGNLTEAKRRAKRVNIDPLVNHFTEIGWSNEKALRAEVYLKHPSQESFQSYCDAN